ncbi:MAG: cation-transporting ATPase [Bdellovibrio sp. ArHS]|uniref:hypothetical protein n=1 Tax=Bdellovibrio sp. ArHS TaxID=1569284 RepID=UPI000582BBDD|nr:hypothetical protein [Bdellovibrio sp. ArHS]KHD90049.1 MAG: cation-transporting ATPase [Bdellovibrio sp. ArHS]
MKIVLALIIAILSTSVSHAWSMSSQVRVSPTGQFQDSVTLYCRPDEALCKNVCNDANSCWKEQEVCFNCLGMANNVLRTVFTELERLYRNTRQVIEVKDVEKVFRKDHVFIAARSIYNFYMDLNKDEVQTLFQSLCPTHSAQPLVVLGKNSNNEPVQIKYIICEGNGQYNQDMYVLEYAPQTQIGNGNLKLNNKP